MSAIKVGDLVVIVKPMPCCGSKKALGKIFEVQKVYVSNGHCVFCKQVFADPIAGAEGPDGLMSAITRLKKIDPPAEGDTLPTRAEKHDQEVA